MLSAAATCTCIVTGRGGFSTMRFDKNVNAREQQGYTDHNNKGTLPGERANER